VAAPPVSIGLPVCDGERHLGEALASILGQGFGDFELLVSDNASTDRTAEIVRDVAARDRRVRYLRNERNLGAAANYDRVFALSRGRFFKWAAHDDVLAPCFLERCLAALEAEPEAVLCHGQVEVIDVAGAPLGVYDSRLQGAAAPRPSTRFAALVLRPHRCNEFFGLIRRRALEGSLLHGRFHGADRALLAQLALRGRLLSLGEPLLRMRQHAAQYSQAMRRPGERRAWHAGPDASRIHLPTFRLYAEYWRMLAREALPAAERARCAGHLLRWWITNWNAARVAADLAGVLAPGAVPAAERLKQRLFAAAPGRLPQ
jgi:glycosyltransferase involved in cell wall biosynthesis